MVILTPDIQVLKTVIAHFNRNYYTLLHQIEIILCREANEIVF